MSSILIFLNLLGGLGVFLLGIKMMSDGLQKAAGPKLRKIISGATGNRFTATLSGIGVTSIIQSSSATTVMVVGFASAGLLTLSQSLGVIFGANIGTTTTAWIISLLGFKVKISLFALPMIGIGFFSQFVQKWPTFRRLGEAMLGFGLLFLGLDLIKTAIPDVQSSAATIEWVTKFSPETLLKLLGVIMVGSVLTLIFQSSSAVMALTLTLAAKGLIDYPTAAALVLGENIGTTITANIAAIGAPRAAKRAAFGHFLFNMLGVLWSVILFRQLLAFVDWVVPGETTGTSPEVLLTSIPFHLAMFHTIFNVVNTGVMLIFIKYFEKLIMVVFPLKRSEEKKTDLVYLKSTLAATPELSLEAVGKEVDRMAGLVELMITKLLHAVKTNSDKLFERAVEEIRSYEQATDVLEYKINDYLKNLTHEPLSRNMISEVMMMLEITSYLEKMGDHCDKIAVLLNKAKKSNSFTQEDIDNLEAIGLKVKRILRHTRPTITEDNFDKAQIMEISLQKERSLNDMRHKFRDEKTMRDYKNQNIDFSPVSLTLYVDILTSFEKIGDYALNIVEATTGIREEMKGTSYAIDKQRAKEEYEQK